jgi:hypothetical protein
MFPLPSSQVMGSPGKSGRFNALQIAAVHTDMAAMAYLTNITYPWQVNERRFLMGGFIHADSHACLVIMCQSVVAVGQLQPRLLSAKIVNDVDTSVSSLSRLPQGGLLGVPMHARGARVELTPLSRRKSRG